MHNLMIKKHRDIISATTCFVFALVVIFVHPNFIYAADEDTGSTDRVISEVEPLPYIIIGALVVFAGIIIFDVIFHPLEEKKDDGKKPVHAKVPEPKTTKSQAKPKYSTDYDYMLGMSAAQAVRQLPATLTRVTPKQ